MNVLPSAFNDPDSPVTSFNAAFDIKSTACATTLPQAQLGEENLFRCKNRGITASVLALKKGQDCYLSSQGIRQQHT